MSDLISQASAAALARGWRYWQDGKILSHEELGGGLYGGTCAGSHGEVYRIRLNPAKPRRSECTCAFAAGRHLVCKHMAALYFALFPEEAARYERMTAEAEAEAEAQREHMERALLRRVHAMKKAELESALLALLFYGPEWQYNDFLRNYVRRGGK